MQDFTLYTPDNAPEASKALLKKSVKAFGMLPNLHAVMAQAPALLEAYQEAHRLFQQTSFNAEELTVVWQSINIEHQCHYCVPAHTAIAHMMKVDNAIIESLRNQTPLANSKLETLRTTTLAMLRKRGVLSNQEKADFFAAGYNHQQLLEIVLGLAQKVMSNYTNHLAGTEVDSAFSEYI